MKTTQNYYFFLKLLFKYFTESKASFLGTEMSISDGVYRVVNVTER